jgi:hypothetical protein
MEGFVSTESYSGEFVWVVGGSCVGDGGRGIVRGGCDCGASRTVVGQFMYPSNPDEQQSDTLCTPESAETQRSGGGEACQCDCRANGDRHGRGLFGCPGAQKQRRREGLAKDKRGANCCSEWGWRSEFSVADVDSGRITSKTRCGCAEDAGNGECVIRNPCGESLSSHR